MRCPVALADAQCCFVTMLLHLSYMYMQLWQARHLGVRCGMQRHWHAPLLLVIELRSWRQPTPLFTLWIVAARPNVLHNLGSNCLSQCHGVTQATGLWLPCGCGSRWVIAMLSKIQAVCVDVIQGYATTEEASPSAGSNHCCPQPLQTHQESQRRWALQLLVMIGCVNKRSVIAFTLGYAWQTPGSYSRVRHGVPTTSDTKCKCA